MKKTCVCVEICGGTSADDEERFRFFFGGGTLATHARTRRPPGELWAQKRPEFYSDLT
jgi:hypothetical protein